MYKEFSHYMCKMANVRNVLPEADTGEMQYCVASKQKHVVTYATGEVSSS